jgi:hypothetical protein
MINAATVRRSRGSLRGASGARSEGECATSWRDDGQPRALTTAAPARRTLARRLLLVVRARVERALAALDARVSDGLYDGDLMALQRGAFCSALENDTRLFRSWGRSASLRAPPFVEVIPARQTIERTCAGASSSPAPLDASGGDDASAHEQLLSPADLARAHQQFLDSLPPYERALFVARPRAERH